MKKKHTLAWDKNQGVMDYKPIRRDEAEIPMTEAVICDGNLNSQTKLVVDGCSFYVCPGHLAGTGAGLQRNLGSKKQSWANVGFYTQFQQTDGRLER